MHAMKTAASFFFTSYTAQCGRIYTLTHSRIFPSYTSPRDGASCEQNSKQNNVSHYNPLNQTIILFKCFTVMCFATQRKATTTKSPAGTSMNLVRLFPLFHTQVGARNPYKPKPHSLNLMSFVILTDDVALRQIVLDLVHCPAA